MSQREQDVAALKSLVLQLHESALNAGVYGGMTVVKTLQERDEWNRSKGERLIRFRALMTEAARIAGAL